MRYASLEQVLFDLRAGDKGITIIKSDNDEKYIPYAKVYENGAKICHLLESKGVQKQQHILIQCKELENFIYVLWACIIGDFVAIPINQSSNEYKLGINKKIAEVLETPYYLYDVEEKLSSEIFNSPEKMIDINKVDFNMLSPIDGESIQAEKEDIAYLLFSSGTTGEPKGVVVSRKNIIENINDLIESLQITSEDSVLTWQPLSHCYGLIVFHLLPAVADINQYLIPVDLFMQQPLLWMKKVDQHRCTRIGTIPFALNHFMDVYQKTGEKLNWDLSCVKSLTIGAEQVSQEVCQAFNKLMRPYRLNQTALIAIYGLTEATAVISVEEINGGINVKSVKRANLNIGEQIEFATDDTDSQLSFVSLGKPLVNCSIKIVDYDNNILGENKIGRVLTKGNNVTQGYYKQSELTKVSFYEDGWLDTGDVGFLSEGRLVLIGREKELVVVNGVKYTCVDIEGIISKCVEKNNFGRCMVCNAINRKENVECAIIFIENKYNLREKNVIREFLKVKSEIKKVVYEVTGLNISEVIPVEKIEVTESGKVRRQEMANKFNNGEFDNIIKQIGILDENGGNRVQVTRDKKTISDICFVIKETIEEMFQIRIESYEVPFKECGIVSINIPPFIQKINEIFNISIEVTALFNSPSINALAKYIYEVVQKKNQVGRTIQVAQTRDEEEEKIAIVGMSCRFPSGANSIEEYWELLMSGKDGISEVPATRWELEKYYDADENVPGKMYCDKGGFLDCPIDEFDARFFNISPKEAAALDPQQRVLLELTWEAFENANLDITKYNGSNTGVCVGISTTEYIMSHLYSGDLSTIDAYSLTGICTSTACGRISYTFGFEGPCFSVDTACSSALTAVHLACTAIKNNETDMMVIGGINLMVSPANSVGFSKLHATSPDGHSKTFDASANGYARSEGGGVIIIKKLSRAIRDNDKILGIIRATGINQDGKSNGLTAPNGKSQVKLIQDTLEAANLNPSEVDYIEMHGTGTKIGDPIEVSAVSEVYGKSRDSLNPVKIGSVKSNIGHMEVAAGMGAIIKVLLSMQHNMIPANLNFKTPNPLINWEDSNVQVVSEHMKWDKTTRPRMAGINGFGFGGSNAHIVIEEYTGDNKINEHKLVEEGMGYILKITAKTETALQKQVENFINVLKVCQDEEVIDVIYTANRGRADLDCRLVVIGDSREQLIDKLQDYLNGHNVESVFTTSTHKNGYVKNRKVVFMFTGQGSQYVNMGKILFDRNDVFKEAMLKCDKLFKPYIIKSIIDLLYSEKATTEIIERTVYAQPLIFAIEYALSKLLESIGIKPEVVMGHSIGEYAAAVASGIFSLEDAVKLVSTRGRLMDMAPGHGAMGTIFATEETVSRILENYEGIVGIAAHNAKESCVISGEATVVEKILNDMAEQGVRVKPLKVSHGFHSRLMEPIMEDFKEIAQEIVYRAPQVRFISAVYGREVSSQEVLDANYWTEHIREKVDFYKAVTSLQEKDYVLVEVGANSVLSALAKLIFDEERIIAHTLKVKNDDIRQIMDNIGKLYVAGVNINWNNIVYKGKKIWEKYTLPLYPFEKQRYWKELKYDCKENTAICDETSSRFLGQRIESPYMEESTIFQRKFIGDNPYFMGEHIIFDTPISPAAAYVSMIISAVKEIANPTSCLIKEIELRVPLTIDNDEERTVQVCIQNKDQAESKFSVVSRTNGVRDAKWDTHTQGFVTTSRKEFTCTNPIDLNEVQNREYDCHMENSLYKFMHDSGFKLGAGFSRITKCSSENGEGISFIEPLTNIPELDMYEIYPGVIDSIFQTLFCMVLDTISEWIEASNGDKTVIPYFIESIAYNYKESKNLWCHTNAKVKDNVIYGYIEVFNEKGESIMQVNNLMAKFTDKENLLREIRKNNNSLYYHTEWIKDQTSRKVKEDIEDTYILVGENDENSNALARCLMDNGHQPICVMPKAGYIKESMNEYYLDGEKENWLTFIKDITTTHDKPRFKVIYVNGIEGFTGNVATKINNVKMDNLKSLLYLVQVIKEAKLQNKFSIKIVTKNVQKIQGDKAINLNQATLWGVAKVLDIEMPEIFSGIVDIDDTCIFENSDKIAKEILSSDTEEVCLRGNNRYISKLIKHADFIKTNKVISQPIQIVPEGTYIITGGTGALGMTYADYLVSRGAKYLVLISRSQPNEEVVQRLNEWQTQGVQVKVVNADVCNEESIKNAFTTIREEFPEIRGVVHAAGVIRDKMLTDQTWDDFEAVLNPKVIGTVNVYNELDKDSLDFFIMLSSITSVLGNMGQSNYAAANYFMNSFAVNMGVHQLPGYAFCWGPWQGSGMASSNEEIDKNLKMMGIVPFNKEVGKQVIDEFFKQPYDNLLIANVNWNKYSDSSIGDSKKAFLEKVIVTKNEINDSNENNTSDSNDVLERLAQMNEAEKKEFLVEQIQRICAQIMGFEKGQLPAVDVPFTEQGVDSLMVFAMRSSLNKLLKTDLSVSTFFNYPSILKLTDYLVDEVMSIDEEEEESTEDILAELESLID